MRAGALRIRARKVFLGSGRERRGRGDGSTRSRPTSLWTSPLAPPPPRVPPSPPPPRALTSWLPAQRPRPRTGSGARRRRGCGTRARAGEASPGPHQRRTSASLPRGFPAPRRRAAVRRPRPRPRVMRHAARRPRVGAATPRALRALLLLLPLRRLPRPPLSCRCHRRLGAGWRAPARQPRWRGRALRREDRGRWEKGEKGKLSSVLVRCTSCRGGGRTGAGRARTAAPMAQQEARRKGRLNVERTCGARAAPRPLSKIRR
jgi:hypothetical protein